MDFLYEAKTFKIRTDNRRNWKVFFKFKGNDEADWYNWWDFNSMEAAMESIIESLDEELGERIEADSR